VIERKVQLNFEKTAIEELALTDEQQAAAGLDAPTPVIDESLNQLSSDEEKVSRREGLVRDE
jgi:hypothetical protein